MQLKEALVNEELVPQQGRDYGNEHVKNEHEGEHMDGSFLRLHVRRRASIRGMPH